MSTPSTRGRLVTACCLAVATLLLAACSGTAKSPSSARRLLSRRQDATRSPRPPRSPTGDIDSFTWSLYAEPLSLAFPYAFDYPPNQVLSNVCESLLRWNADLSISPGLASAYANPTRPPGCTTSATA